jgi:hypothetical protein
MHQSNLDLSEQAHALIQQQATEWPMMRDGLAALKTIRTRTIDLDDFSMRVQLNSGRIISASAKVDPKTIQQRRCFLCLANLPPQQRGLPLGGRDFTVLCNPFPIFPEHFTIVHNEHRPQRIADSFVAMLDLAAQMGRRYTVFYNGPRCGASAPDHLHFQAGDRKFMTIESEYERLKGDPIAKTASSVHLFAKSSPRSFIAFESNNRDALVDAFLAFYWSFKDLISTDDEPMMNVLTWHEQEGWNVIIFPRFKHRPSFYFAEGDDRILLSPASVDLGGVCIVPLEHDFHKLTRDHIEQMLREVMLPTEIFTRLTDRLRKN